MDQDIPERTVVSAVSSLECHSGNPEENDVISGHQRVRWIVPFQICRILRPSEGGKRPESAGKPCIKHIFILFPVTAFRGFGSHIQLSGCFAGPGRDAVAPPELTGDAPVFYVFQPLRKCVFKPFGNKTDFLVGNLLVLQDFFCQGFHLHKPLFRKIRFNNDTRALGVTNLMQMLLNVVHNAGLFKILNQGFPAFKPVHPGIFPTHLIHGSIIIHADGHGKIILFRQSKVVGVMRRGAFHDRCPELHVNVVICHDRQRFSICRVDGVQTHYVFVAFVIGMHKDGLVSEHGLRAGRGNDQFLSGLLYLVPEVIHVSHDFFVLHFDVGQCCSGFRIPVDDALSLVDQSIVVQIHKHFIDGLGQTIIHRKTLSAVIEG